MKDLLAILPKKFILISVALIAFVLMLMSFKAVPSGHVGVVRTFGAVHENPMSEGFNLKRPFLDKVTAVNIMLQSKEVTVSAASKDLQTVQTEVSLQYSLIGSVVPSVLQRIGRREHIDATVIFPAISESVKSVTARFTAEELVTQRAKVKLEMEQEIQTFISKTLEDKGVPGAMQIANVAITDFQFSQEFNASIEAKVKAEQDALRAENEKIQRITEAEAGAAEIKLAAEAEAYQVEVTSTARADAIRREASALAQNPLLIDLRSIEKWDGKLPMINGGQSLPMVDLRDLPGN